MSRVWVNIRQELTKTGKSNAVEEEWVVLRDKVLKAADDQISRTGPNRNHWIT